MLGLKLIYITLGDQARVSFLQQWQFQVSTHVGFWMPQHIDVWTKWTTVRRWHFQMHFIEWWVLYYYSNLQKSVPGVPIENQASLVQVITCLLEANHIPELTLAQSEPQEQTSVKFENLVMAILFSPQYVIIPDSLPCEDHTQTIPGAYCICICTNNAVLS